MRRKIIFIKLKLFSAFIVLCLLPMLIISIHNYYQIQEQIQSSTFHQLEALAKIKALHIERYYHQSKIELQTIAMSPYVHKIIMDGSKTDVQLKTMFLKQLKNFMEPREIDEVYILNTKGIVVAYTLHDETTIADMKDALKYGKERTYFSDIYKGHTGNHDYLFLASTPIMDEHHNYIGTVVAEFKANTLFEQIQDYTGLGETGETLLGKEFGDEVVFLNPLRHDIHASLTRRAKMGSQIASPMQSASSGHSGEAVSIDYRGEKVLAAWKYIPETRWGIVAKIDAVEVFKALESYKISIVLTALIVFMFGIGASWKIAQNLMRPIEQIDYSANIDALTNLPNRRLLMELLEGAVQEAKIDHSMLAVLFLDLDGFKEVNDTYGHETGDWLLNAVAHRLHNAVRTNDIVARLGGDEFIVLLKDVDGIENIKTVAEALIETLNEPFIKEEKSIKIGTSIGICVCAEPNCPDIHTILKKADKAMYTVKQYGKNHFLFAE